jgi:hypothetical protein
VKRSLIELKLALIQRGWRCCQGCDAITAYAAGRSVAESGNAHFGVVTMAGARKFSKRASGWT